MNSNKFNIKAADALICLLIFILITLISYNIYLLIHNSNNTIPPKNSIEVFPS